MMCNNFASQSCSSAGAPFHFIFIFFSPPHFYVFTIGDKAPTGFTIMLCRCSQQERVIAVGVWGSPRRFGGSGQSCQKLPEDSAVLRTPAPAKCRKTVCLSFHFACDAASVRAARASVRRHPGRSSARFFRLSIDNCIKPTCWLGDSGGGGVSGTCQRRHACPPGPRKRRLHARAAARR